MNTPDKIIVHHTVTPKHTTAQNISQGHKARWNGYAKSRRKEASYAGYTYIIEWDGKTVQCRDHDEEGIHCRGQNFSSIGVAFIGHFNNHMPSKAQEEAFKKLYKKLSKEFGQLPIYPHRKYANKDCPGTLITDSYFTELVAAPDVNTLRVKAIQLMQRLVALLLQRRMKG